jgi:hypothetical protein
MSAPANGIVPAICIAPTPLLAEWTGRYLSAAHEEGTLSGFLLNWALMTAAMTSVLAVPMTRHVAARNFRSRRDRAIALFLGSAIAVWMLSGIAFLPALVGIAYLAPDPRLVGIIGFVVAALWQFAPMKRRALLVCHKTTPLAAFGWQADLDCLRAGGSYGRQCVVGCWAMMIAAMLVPHGFLATICVLSIASRERTSGRANKGGVALLLACSAMAIV